MLSEHKIKVYELAEALEKYANETKEVLLETDLLNTLERALKNAIKKRQE